jgi:5-methylthioadenosine/S-adenosylhomocysteine deaminase
MIIRTGICLLAAGASLAQAPRRTVSLIVTSGTLITMDAAGRILSPGAVAIDGRDLVAIDTPEAIARMFEARETLDAAGHVVMPGLINTHTHAPMVLYRGLADDLALMEWLQKYIFPAESKTVTPAFVRAGTRLAALEMIQSGTTTYADMYYFEEAIARATKDAGLRGLLGQTIIGFPAPDARTPADGIARAEAFIEEWTGDDLIVPAVAPHAMYTLDSATMKAVGSLAHRVRAPIITHLAETRDEVTIAREKFGMTPAAYLDSLGLLGPRTLAAHAIWLTPDDVRLLARRRVGIAHNPESNMKLASGTAPVPSMLTAGIAVGLGTDGAASNNDLDMFEAMRQAALLHKLQSNDPRVIPARAALEMATAGAARALGLGDLIGSLEAGKRADLIVVSLGAVRQTPVYDPLSHLVYVTRGDDVVTTVVNGKVLMRDRKVLSLDQAVVIAEARAIAARVLAAVSP